MSGLSSLVDALAAAGDPFGLQVRSARRGDAVAALARVAEELVLLPGAESAEGPRISAIASLPEGPFLTVGSLAARPGTHRRAAELVEEALAENGLDADDVVVLTLGGLDDLDLCRNAVILRLFPPPAGAAGQIRPSWIDVAAEWVFGDLPGDTPVRIRVLGLERQVRAAEAAGMLHGCATARTWCDVVSGDTADRVRTASLTFGTTPHVAVGAGGPACDERGMAARFGLLADVARDLAERVGYACVDLESTFENVGIGLVGNHWAAEGGAPPNLVASRLVDRFLPGAFPFQIVTGAHVDVLDPAVRRKLPVEQVGVDRLALAVGDPLDWMPGSDVREDVLGDAWIDLEPALLRADQVEAVLEGTAADADPVEATGPLDMPDLDAITLDGVPHPRRGTRLTALELAAWLAGGRHTDHPEGVSPVLATFVRLVGAGVDDDIRQALGRVVPSLLGTAGDGADTSRSWLATDWLVRTQAARWLEASGLHDMAAQLTALPVVSDNAALIEAVEVLGHAVVVAAKRLEITRSMVGPHAEEALDRVAWELWEESADRAAWVAASEAGTYGAPPDLTYATDQRVIDVSRDPRARAAVEQSKRSVGDATWSAALHEVATMAWREAWEKAEQFVYHESTFSILVTLRRSLETSPTFDGDPVAVELALDNADQAAIDALARVALAGRDEPDPWSAAVRSASATADGVLWAAALQDARDVVGAELFDEAVAVARGELDRWLRRAPDLVGRTVACAVAREVASAAGRGLVAQAAAPVLARGGTDDAARRAAAGEVDAVVRDLAVSAVALIDDLVAPG